MAGRNVNHECKSVVTMDLSRIFGTSRFQRSSETDE